MTFIEVICALVILGFFFSGFSQIFLPAYSAWEKAVKTYQSAQTINFIRESFKIECAKPDRNMDRWKYNISAVKELEEYEVFEYWQENIPRAIKLTCFISGEKIEIIGLCGGAP